MARTLYGCSAAFAFLTLAAMGADLAVAQYFEDHELPGDFGKLVLLSEVFAHGAGVACILLAAYVLDPANRRRMLRAVTIAFGAGLLGNLVKCLVARARPRAAEFTEVVDSFGGWLPWLTWSDDRAWDGNWQSFPSGHAASAAGLAVALSVLYPRGRWLFVVFAMLAGTQRMAADAHYLSDLMAAASLACLWGGCCCDPRWLGRHFDRFEHA